MKKITAVVGDLGGVKELLPGIRVLEKRGDVEVRWIVDRSPLAKARDFLQKEGVPFTCSQPDLAVDIIVVGTSATAFEAQVAWTRFGNENDIPVIWVEDIWGTAERSSVQSVSPDLLCVIDEEAKYIANEVRPDIPIIIVGKPSFGSIAPLVKNAADLRMQVRMQCGILEEDLLVTYSSGGREKLVIPQLESLKQLQGHARLAVRLHPKLPRENIDLETLFMDHHCLVSTEGRTTEEVALASDVLVGPWNSTIPYVAALAGVIPLIAYYPDSDEEERKACGFPSGTSPLLSARCGWAILNGTDLLHKVLQFGSNAFARELLQKEAIKRFGNLVLPGAPDRIADAIESYH